MGRCRDGVCLLLLLTYLLQAFAAAVPTVTQLQPLVISHLGLTAISADISMALPWCQKTTSSTAAAEAAAAAPKTQLYYFLQLSRRDSTGEQLPPQQQEQDQLQWRMFPGLLSSDCRTLTFHVTPNDSSSTTLSIGIYDVAVVLSAGSHGSSTYSTYEVNNNTTSVALYSPWTVEVVQAMSIRMQSKQVDLTQGSNQLLTIPVLVTSASPLPASVALELSGAAQLVGDKVLRWGPGNTRAQNFTVKLLTAGTTGNSSTIVAVARIVPLDNAELASEDNSTTGIRIIAAPHVVLMTTVLSVYRNDAIPSAGPVITLHFDLEHMEGPYPISVSYSTFLLKAEGCADLAACAAAVRQNGTVEVWNVNGSAMLAVTPLSLGSSNSSNGSGAVNGTVWQPAWVQLAVQWPLVPYSAELQVGINLSTLNTQGEGGSLLGAGDSLEGSNSSADAVAFVFGVASGQCPPGSSVPDDAKPTTGDTPGDTGDTGSPLTAAVQDMFLSLCCEQGARLRNSLLPPFDPMHASGDGWSNFTLMLPFGYAGGRSQLVVRLSRDSDVVLVPWSNCADSLDAGVARSVLQAGFQPTGGQLGLTFASVALDLSWLYSPGDACDLTVLVLSPKYATSSVTTSRMYALRDAALASVGFEVSGQYNVKLLPLLDPSLMQLAGLSYASPEMGANAELATVLPLCGLPGTMQALAATLPGPPMPSSPSSEETDEETDASSSYPLPTQQLLSNAISGDTLALAVFIIRVLSNGSTYATTKQYDAAARWVLEATAQGSFRLPPMLPGQQTTEGGPGLMAGDEADAGGDGGGADGTPSPILVTLNPHYRPVCSADARLFVNIQHLRPNAVMVPELVEGAAEVGVKVLVGDSISSVGSGWLSFLNSPNSAASSSSSSSLPAGLVEVPLLLIAPDRVSSRTLSTVLFTDEAQLAGVPTNLTDDGIDEGGGSVQALSSDSVSLSQRLQSDLFGQRPSDWPPSPAQSCSICPNGTFAMLPNSASCQLCPPGMYTDTAMAWNCSTCPPGTFSFTWAASTCRNCLSGTFSSGNASTMCELCPKSFSNYFRGSTNCSVDLRNRLAYKGFPGSGGSGSVVNGSIEMVKVLVTFTLVLDVTPDALASLSPGNSGINASSNAILKLFIQADTEDALMVPPPAITVSDIRQVGTRQFSVDVRAKLERQLFVKLATRPWSDADADVSTPDDNDEEDDDLSADDLVGKLSGADVFPRTSQSTGGEVHATDVVQKRVGQFEDYDRQPNVHTIVWPTLIGTFALAGAMLYMWTRWRRRRGQRGCIASIKIMECCCCRVDGDNSEYTSAATPEPAMHTGAELELHSLPGGLFAARFRINRNKSSTAVNSLLEPGSVSSSLAAAAGGPGGLGPMDVGPGRWESGGPEGSSGQGSFAPTWSVT